MSSLLSLFSRLRIVCCLAVCLLATVLHAQTLQSPEAFLGYKLGTQFTPHYKIVNYVKAAAQARPDMVKLQPYGYTNEGRELLTLIVAAPQNMQRIEDIRQGNLRLAGLQTDKPVAQNVPIVWLSYNVHGNEPSSSEAAMQTLYALLDPTNTNAQQWLKNTVVIIDPCLNPDGRDRYVNWYNSMKGAVANADPQSREHMEPWPGGRSNHYNFDLNRDWAWQTQVETRQRMKLYNQWMPQVHVDFHEQYYNNPYYFAPAAEPFHEVITPWQREFQEIIGKNNARYFDQNGWLYFTKESFDLFYPSYGDTYPLYNGAIGMTYEQGGHSRAGLAVTTAGGDTLTLEDRIAHHFTTGMATIEAASQHADKLLEGFRKFFEDSRAGKGAKAQTYVLTSDNAAAINNVAQLLQLNNISYGSMGNAASKATNYANGKQEKITLKQYNIAIPANQTKGVLARVLLEPQSVLADSVTYDITAWSLAYAHNVIAYASSEALAIQPFKDSIYNKPLQPAYGYLIRYNSINSVQMLAQLLKQRIKVRCSEKPFTYNKQVYERGTLVVLQHGNPANLPELLSKLAVTYRVDIAPVATGFMEKGPDFGSADVRFVRAPRVALISGEQALSTAAGEVWHLFDQQLNYPLSLLNANDIARINLSSYNVLIIPDGNYRFFDNKAVVEKLKDFVHNGGNLIAMEGALQQMATNPDWGLKQKESANKDDKGDSAGYDLLKRYENRERDNATSSIPGAIYKIDLDNSHPMAFGYPSTYYMLKQDPAVFEFLKDGWNVGVVKKENYVTGFAGNKVKMHIKDGLVFGAINMGNGTLVAMADNPLFRQFWEGGKLLFCNAVFLVNGQ